MTKSPAIETFLADTRVQAFLGYPNDVNIFSILDLDEYRHSNLMAWLLNPRGSHMHGDHYLKALLFAIASAQAEVQELPMSKRISFLTVDSFALGDAIVDRELWLDANNRIDVSIRDHANEFLILIETKTAAPHSPSQLRRYLKLVQKRFRSIRQVLLVFMHFDHNCADQAESPWLGLTYDWLQQAIEARLHRNVPDIQHVDHLLQFYSDWLNDEYSFRDALEYKVAALHITTEHADFISSVLTRVQQPTYNLDTVIEGDAIQRLYARHFEKFDYLFEFSRWSLLGEQIKQQLNQYPLDYYFTRTYLQVHNEDWRAAYEANPENLNYQIWIDIYEASASRKNASPKKLQVELRYDKDKITSAVSARLRAIFKSTARQRRLAHASLDIPKTSNSGARQQRLMTHLVPILDGMIDGVNKALP